MVRVLTRLAGRKRAVDKRLMEPLEVLRCGRKRVNWGELLDQAWGNDIDDVDEERQDESGCDISEASNSQPTVAVRPICHREEICGKVYKPRKLFPAFADTPERVQAEGNKENRKKRKRETLDLIKSQQKKQRPLTPIYESRLQKCKPVNGKSQKYQQLCLDLGQKNFGHVTCKVCGMVYTYGQAEDEGEHSKFHRKYLKGVSFQGWKKERVVAEYFDGRVIVVYPTDPKHHLKKVQELCALVDSELGYAAGIRPWNISTKIFLYISTDKKVIGCIFAEKISQGYRVLSPTFSSSACPGTDNSESVHTPLTNSLSKSSESDNDCVVPSSREIGSKLDTLSAWYCSSNAQPAVVGVNRVWVCQQHRRRGVASRILDVIRLHFLPGSVITTEQLAFSDPTPSGKAFAASYCSTDNFLVYRWTT